MSVGGDQLNKTLLQDPWRKEKKAQPIGVWGGGEGEEMDEVKIREEKRAWRGENKLL